MRRLDGDLKLTEIASRRLQSGAKKRRGAGVDRGDNIH